MKTLNLNPGNYFFRWPDPEITGAEIRCQIVVDEKHYKLTAFSFHLETFESQLIPRDSDRLWIPLMSIIENLNRLKTD